MHAYKGPLRDGPLAVELHNTRYASAGEPRDGLADVAGVRAWLLALGPRLPDWGAGDPPGRRELCDLRDWIRDGLHAAIEGGTIPSAALNAINAASVRARVAPVARRGAGAGEVLTGDYGEASRADVMIGTLAADAVDLLTGPGRGELRACGAPGCVLLYRKSHPRQEWCSAACGNRARQARHYARTRRRGVRRGKEK